MIVKNNDILLIGLLALIEIAQDLEHGRALKQIGLSACDGIKKNLFHRIAVILGIFAAQMFL
ncbi:MAG: hypothetical protein AAFX04_13270 [Pseudomonadota bacterium]